MGPFVWHATRLGSMSDRADPESNDDHNIDAMGRIMAQSRVVEAT